MYALGFQSHAENVNLSVVQATPGDWFTMALTQYLHQKMALQHETVDQITFNSEMLEQVARQETFDQTSPAVKHVLKSLRTAVAISHRKHHKASQYNVLWR